VEFADSVEGGPVPRRKKPYDLFHKNAVALADWGNLDVNGEDDGYFVMRNQFPEEFHPAMGC
jgi:hypothetical protein